MTRPPGRLDPILARVRQQLRGALEALGPDTRVLVACSGGPDSLALAWAATFFAADSPSARRRGPWWPLGAVIVDHQMQRGSDVVAARTAQLLRSWGLSPVVVERVRVGAEGGPEAAARQARYAAFEAVAARVGAGCVLLGHTRDDQAEQVLLGLVRGSGTRSLAGMPVTRSFPGGVYWRPLLTLSRDDTARVCAVAGLNPWQDPSNADTSMTRARIRHEVLPLLERQLGPGVAQALARSAAILTDDADYLDARAGEECEQLRPQEGGCFADAHPQVAFPVRHLRTLAGPIRRRVLMRAVQEVGGQQPSFERLRALDALAMGEVRSGGPVQLAGGVEAYRRRCPEGMMLVFVAGDDRR